MTQKDTDPTCEFEILVEGSFKTGKFTEQDTCSRAADGSCPLAKLLGLPKKPTQLRFAREDIGGISRGMGTIAERENKIQGSCTEYQRRQKRKS